MKETRMPPAQIVETPYTGLAYDNNPALVEIMAWRRIGDKSLSQPMLTQFTDAHMWH